MRVASALVLSLSLATGACFPNNARHRTIAKITEGGVLLGGIALLAVVNSGADCMTEIPSMPDEDCESKARLLSNIGLGLVLTGLVGFIVTVSTSDDDKASSTTTIPATTTPLEPAPAPAPAPTPAPAPAPAP